MSETPWLIPSGVKIWHAGRAVQPNAEMRRLEGELDKAERRVNTLLRRFDVDADERDRLFELADALEGESDG